MEIHNNGTLELSGVDESNRKKVERLFERIFGAEANEFPPPGDVREFGLYDCGGKLELNIEEAFGDIDDMVRKFVRLLKRLGVSVSGSYKWYGDYDGFGVMRDGQLETYDIEEYSLRCREDDCLIEEMKRRGYSVVKTAKTKNESKEKQNGRKR